MKIRHGFISNSSSTSFTFCFRGKEDLYNLIWKYRDYFSLSTIGWTSSVFSCNACSVVACIESVVVDNVKDDWKETSVKNIEEEIKNFEECLKETEETIKRAKEDGDKEWLVDMYKKSKENLIAHCDRLKTAKEKGLNKVLVVEFGDNHGHIQGGDVGNAMDYEGRNIDIDEKDFIVFTEQNR